MAPLRRPPEVEGPARPDRSDVEGVLSRAPLERLALYHQIVSRMGEQGNDTISSAGLASLLHIDPTLVRKDMAIVGVTGRPKVGYQVADVINRLDEVLGLGSRKNAILIGCGRLGSAIVAYGGFAQYGLKISAVFDTDYAKVGQSISGNTILPMEKCRNVVEIFGIEIAILTVPAAEAQQLADWLVTRGIRAIWNFSPVQLRAPDDVVVRNENLAQGLAQLIHRLKQVKSQPAPPGEGGKRGPWT
jgi:redox-sensing transcriptional repressor